MPKHKVAIISDTHELLRSEVASILSECEVIFHAGDVCSREIKNKIQDLAPLNLVRGNNDFGWARDIPMTLQTEYAGFSFVMAHMERDLPYPLPKADFIIFGHTHKYYVSKEPDHTWINPGSAGPWRFGSDLSMAILTLDSDQHTFKIEKIDLTKLVKNPW